MDYIEGYVYHIKDSYFIKANDDKLMKNKENGNFRPTFYCFKDSKTSLLWVVPLSSRVEKYQAIVEKQKSRYGESLGIYIGSFDGKKSAFLIQNMFPITEKYLDHIHTRNGNPIPVKENVRREVESRVKRAYQLYKRGKKVVFPNIEKLEHFMLTELTNEIKAQTQPKDDSSKRSVQKSAQEIQENERRNSPDKEKAKSKNEISL